MGAIKLAVDWLAQIAANEFLRRIGSAILEVLCVGTLGVTPLLAASFLNIHSQDGSVAGSMANLRQYVQLGQLFLYSFAMIGTLLWLLLARSTGAHLLFRVLLGLATLAVAIIAVGVFMQDPRMSTQLNDFLVQVSFGCFFTCLITYFFLLMCESAPPRPAGAAFQPDINKLVQNAEAAGQ